MFYNTPDRSKGEGLKQDLARMTSTLTHRGPDQSGVFFHEGPSAFVGLGHRRLSIIDLTENGRQPMSNEDGSIQLVFNGEIYNFAEIAKELKQKGHVFKSNSDSEVIIHLYEELGLDCVDRLDGMFAFAIFDKPKQRLFVARDRVGIKPLFYTINNDSVFFASEIKSLLLLDEVSREIDYTSFDSYFTYGYIPGERTIFKDIRKLPPGNILIHENKNTQIKRFWSINYFPKNNASEDEIAEGLRDVVTRAVNRHLVSDVPLGAFLSGGVDSSIVVAAMHLAGETSVDTLSIGYESAGQDELGYAAAVAQMYKTNHTEFKIDPDMTHLLPLLLWHLDEPFFDNSIIPTYFISKLARAKVTVALSGDGGDELFGGYDWTRRYQFAAIAGKFPKFATGMLGLLEKSNDPENDYKSTFSAKLGRFAGDLTRSMEDGFKRRTTVSNRFRKSMYSNNMLNLLGNHDAAAIQSDLFAAAEVDDPREAMLYVDTMSYMPDDCLFKVDRMSMAHGLEVRVPLLDREVIEYAAQIPYKYKVKGLTSKHILKKAFAPHLPDIILKQRKQGFTVPVSEWLRNGLGKMAEDIILSPELEGRRLFNTNRLSWMLDEHRSGRQDLGHRIWSVVVFEIWARLFLDKKIEEPPSETLKEMSG